ncbi:acylphosphatase-2-like [Paramormyrops kingsleyae]|uniref:acylphosphatase-2-like n=1 Tax=Paramormyrops kingsleyae TaxID=1676925 RepID=UPI003B977C6A
MVAATHIIGRVLYGVLFKGGILQLPPLAVKGITRVPLSIRSSIHSTQPAMSELISVDYEVFGEVQGVFFRKYTEQEGKRLQLVGWVRNTNRDTVEGQIQGPKETVEKMKDWLRNIGSPMSRIDKATFSNEHAIPALQFTSFATRY